VTKDHLDTLREFDDVDDPRMHNIVTELLVYAGDAAAPEEYARLIERQGAIFPYWEEPFVQRNAPALQPAAHATIRRFKDRLYAPAAEVLLRAKDASAPEVFADHLKTAVDPKPGLKYLSVGTFKRHRKHLATFASHEDPEVRFYADAGLAQLGDNEAKHKVAAAISLSPHSSIRYHAAQHVPRMDVPALITAWKTAAPEEGTEIERAVHAFALKHLEALKP
jgi:hypothetical protein